jgi:hypothetical protein
LRMGMKNCPISKESRSLAFSAVAIWHIIVFFLEGSRGQR